MGLGCKPIGKNKRIMKRLENDMAKIEALDKIQKDVAKAEKRQRKNERKSSKNCRPVGTEKTLN